MKLKNQNIRAEKQIIEAFNLLNELKIEIISVVDQDNEEIGSISITDVNKALGLGIQSKPVSLITKYFEEPAKEESSISREELKNRINKILPEYIKEAIEICSELAKKENIQVYLVGGLVRDLIREAKNLDLDITMESQGIEFAKKLAQNYKNVELKEVHEDFGTAKVIIKTPEKEVDIDIASTRTEYYKHPGDLPTIKTFNCKLEEDLYRRDFTINAMAINISPESYCQITDNLGGLNDIDNKILRIIHPVSFIDDPTRVIRGVEFAVRFNYKFSSGTKKLITEAIKSKVFDNFCTERLKLELKPCLNLNNIEVIEYIKEYNLQNLLDPAIKLESMENFDSLIKNIKYHTYYINKENIWLILLACILQNLPDKNIERVLENLYLTNNEKEIISRGISLIKAYSEIDTASKPSEIYNIFKNYQPESILISSFLNNKNELQEKIHNYFEHYSKVKTYTTGKTLVDLGFKPGPIFSEVLNKLLELKLDGKITNQTQEISFIKENYIS